MPEISNTTVGVTATQVLAKSPTRFAWSIANEGSSKIYIGPDSNVTTATGYPIAAGTSFGVARDNQSHHPANGPIYAISGSAGQDVRAISF